MTGDDVIRCEITRDKSCFGKTKYQLHMESEEGKIHILSATKKPFKDLKISTPVIKGESEQLGKLKRTGKSSFTILKPVSKIRKVKLGDIRAMVIPKSMIPEELGTIVYVCPLN